MAQVGLFLHIRREAKPQWIVSKISAAATNADIIIIMIYSVDLLKFSDDLDSLG